jgi:hypothetical protein
MTGIEGFFFARSQGKSEVFNNKIRKKAGISRTDGASYLPHRG